MSFLWPPITIDRGCNSALCGNSFRIVKNTWLSERFVSAHSFKGFILRWYFFWFWPVVPHVLSRTHGGDKLPHGYLHFHFPSFYLPIDTHCFCTQGLGRTPKACPVTYLFQSGPTSSHFQNSIGYNPRWEPNIQHMGLWQAYCIQTTAFT